jgi:hypothetical protein
MKLGKVNIEGMASGTSNFATMGKENVCVPRLEISDRLRGTLIATICNRIEFSVVKKRYSRLLKDRAL